MGIISLRVYTNRKFTLFNFKAIILRIAGNKYNTNGYKRPKIKLEIESLIKAL